MTKNINRKLQNLLDGESSRPITGNATSALPVFPLLYKIECAGGATANYDLDQLQDTDKYVTVDGGVTLDTVQRFRENPNVNLVCGSKVIFNENYHENMKCLTS